MLPSINKEKERERGERVVYVRAIRNERDEEYASMKCYASIKKRHRFILECNFDSFSSFFCHD